MSREGLRSSCHATIGPPEALTIDGRSCTPAAAQTTTPSVPQAGAPADETCCAYRSAVPYRLSPHTIVKPSPYKEPTIAGVFWFPAAVQTGRPFGVQDGALDTTWA